MGEAKLINVWAGFLGSPGSLGPFVGKAGCSAWGSCPGRNILHMLVNLCFEGRKILFVKEQLKNRKLSVDKKEKKPTSF